jgi:hypothetical protein
LRISPRIFYCFTLTFPAAVVAQSAPANIGLQGTAAYALIWNRAAHAVDSPYTAQTARFNGRIALKVGRNVYLGISAGSWMYAADFGEYDSDFGQSVVAVATAVVTTAFAQTYPVRAVPFFVRAGLGFASTATYTPTPLQEIPAPLIEDRHGRFALTAGTGIDIPLRQHFAVTLSADYTRLTGTATGFESTAAVQLGLGLTVR